MRRCISVNAERQHCVTGEARLGAKRSRRSLQHLQLHRNRESEGGRSRRRGDCPRGTSSPQLSRKRTGRIAGTRVRYPPNTLYCSLCGDDRQASCSACFARRPDMARRDRRRVVFRLTAPPITRHRPRRTQSFLRHKRSSYLAHTEQQETTRRWSFAASRECFGGSGTLMFAVNEFLHGSSNAST